VEKMESENADVDPVVVVPREGSPDPGAKEVVENPEPVEGVVADAEPPVFEKENSEATLPISDGPEFNELAAKLKPVGCAWSWFACCVWPCGGFCVGCWLNDMEATPDDNSKRVGGLGTGGMGVATGPNGFLVPVWCVLTGCKGGDVVPPARRGVDAGLGGTENCAGC